MDEDILDVALDEADETMVETGDIDESVAAFLRVLVRNGHGDSSLHEVLKIMSDAMTE